MLLTLTPFFCRYVTRETSVSSLLQTTSSDIDFLAAVASSDVALIFIAVVTASNMEPMNDINKSLIRSIVVDDQLPSRQNRTYHILLHRHLCTHIDTHSMQLSFLAPTVSEIDILS